jgi:hypothetical protein
MELDPTCVGSRWAPASPPIGSTACERHPSAPPAPSRIRPEGYTVVQAASCPLLAVLPPTDNCAPSPPLDPWSVHARHACSLSAGRNRDAAVPSQPPRLRNVYPARNATERRTHQTPTTRAARARRCRVPFAAGTLFTAPSSCTTLLLTPPGHFIASTVAAWCCTWALQFQISPSDAVFKSSAAIAVVACA